MTLIVPLNVRFETDNADVHVTRELRDLRFRCAIPGGYANASVQLDRPLTLDPDEFQLYATMYIYDGRNGQTLFEGRLEDPGRGADESGRIWTVSAVGMMAHASDRQAALIYVDTNLDEFVEKAWGADKHAREQIDVDANELPAVRLGFDRDYVVANSKFSGLRYRRIAEAGQKLGYFNYSWDGGVTDANFQLEAVTRPATTSAGTIVRSNLLNVAGGGTSGQQIVTDFPNGDTVLELRLRNISGGNVTIPNDVYYALFGTFVVSAMRYNKDGTEKTSGYLSSLPTADDIVSDLLGRLLPHYDGAGARVDATSYVIGQLMYENGVTPAEVLNDLMDNFETAYYWAVWETTPNSTGNRFEWVKWPTTVRYECDADDGFSAPGSAVDLYNRVHVRWRNENGRIRTTTRTQTVDVLDSAGLTREAFIDLADELASLTNAQRAGDQFLAAHATAPNQGTLTIRRPIPDLIDGGLRQPWELLPGTLIRVRNVTPRVDALNATDRDGATIFRVYATEYDASSNTATLELDSGVRSFRRASVHRHSRIHARPSTRDERKKSPPKKKKHKRTTKHARSK